MDPFTQVTSAKQMVKSKTRSISNRAGAFSNFSQNWTSAPPQFTERWIDNFLKITTCSWSGSHLFFYEAWAQKSQQNSRTRMSAQIVRAQIKLGYPVWNLSDSSKSRDDPQIKGVWRCRQSCFRFPDLSRKDRSDSATCVLWPFTCI